MHNAFMDGKALMEAQAGRLKKARQAHGKYRNASEAARAMGIPEPTYLGHEGGTRGMGRNAYRYAAFYRVSLGWLLWEFGPMKIGQKEPVLELYEAISEEMRPQVLEWMRILATKRPQ